MANIVALIGAYISLRVNDAVLKVEVDNLKTNVNALGGKYRSMENEIKLKGA